MTTRTNGPPTRTRRVRRYALLLGLLVGLALAPAVSQALRERRAEPSSTGSDVAESAAVTASASMGGAVPARDTAIVARQPAGADGQRFTHRSARLADVARSPVALRIDALDLHAPVVARGRSADGQLDVPPDPATVVWYRSGSVPGSAGSAVLAAHVDHAGKPGAFFALHELRPGDTAAVEFDDGSTVAFEVFDQAMYRKRVLPIEELFTRNGDAVLTLITCGGQFNHTTRHYDSNTVVQATMTDLK